MFFKKISYMDKRKIVMMAHFFHNSSRTTFTFHDYNKFFPNDDVCKRNKILKKSIKWSKKKYGGYYEYRCDEHDCLIFKYDHKRSRFTYCRHCHTKLGFFNSINQGISETTGCDLLCTKCGYTTDTGPDLPSDWRVC